MNYFVTAIGTDSGKTVTSAILAESLGADYWKPIQAGRPTDSDVVRTLVSPQTHIHPEKYLLNTPASPHAAAEIEGVEIKIENITLPETSNSLVIEGAGGVLVPLNKQGQMIIDLVPQFRAEIILVCNLYLGSINHSLLTIELIRSRGYILRGIIFNGPSTPTTESIIMKFANVDCLLKIDEEQKITPELIKKYATKLKKKLIEKNGYELD